MQAQVFLWQANSTHVIRFPKKEPSDHVSVHPFDSSFEFDRLQFAACATRRWRYEQRTSLLTRHLLGDIACIVDSYLQDELIQ